MDGTYRFDKVAAGSSILSPKSGRPWHDDLARSTLLPSQYDVSTLGLRDQPAQGIGEK
jgi:hypothetical protein